MIRQSSKLAGAIALGSLAVFAGTADAAPLSPIPDLTHASDLRSTGRPSHAFGSDAAVIKVQGVGLGYGGTTGGLWLRLPGLNWNAPPAGYCGPYGFSAPGWYSCRWMRASTAGGRRWYTHMYWGHGYERAPTDGY